jgi:hypothetical protein
MYFFLGDRLLARKVKFFPFGRSMLTLLNKGLVIEYTGMPGVTGKKSHGGKHNERRHRPGVLIPGYAKDIILEISVEDQPGVFLSFPGRVCKVEQVGDKKCYLVSD